MYHIIVTLARNKFLSRVIKFPWFLLARAYERTGGLGGSSPYLKEVPTCGSATHSGGVGGGGKRAKTWLFSDDLHMFFSFLSRGGCGREGDAKKAPNPFWFFLLIFFIFLHTHIGWLDVVLASCMYICMYIPTCLCMYIVHMYMYINYMYVQYMLSIILFNCAYITSYVTKSMHY